MDGMFGGYIYHKNQLNVVEYTIHWMDPMGDADGDCYWVGLEANFPLFFPQESTYAPLHETRKLAPETLELVQMSFLLCFGLLVSFGGCITYNIYSWWLQWCFWVTIPVTARLTSPPGSDWKGTLIPAVVVHRWLNFLNLSTFVWDNA